MEWFSKLRLLYQVYYGGTTLSLARQKLFSEASLNSLSVCGSCYYWFVGVLVMLRGRVTNNKFRVEGALDLGIRYITLAGGARRLNE